VCPICFTQYSDNHHLSKEDDLGRATAVLDVGKTVSKISLWDSAGGLITRETRPNRQVESGGHRVLDTEGIETWLADTFRRLTSYAEIGSIIPVGHGAAAVLVRDGNMVDPPVDYEEPVSTQLRALYDERRDPFFLTGSPALPNGLNLGVQLFRVNDTFKRDTRILLWPQYWAWRLSGMEASEVTSLGCHTDLWYPKAGRFSGLAESMEWSSHFPPLRRAGEVLGTIKPEWPALLGLRRDTKIHCGLHDSNAALLAARSYPELAGKESTVLSTGTWFVAMRSPASDAQLPELQEDRDCLFNVDVHGKPVPSARFMGGREIEMLGGIDSRPTASMLAALPRVIESGVMALPTFVPGVGPFRTHKGCWLNKPDDEAAQCATVCLYAAMVANASLNLIGAKERILIEGRFAQIEPFVQALAALRPRDAIFATDGGIDASFGALSLLNQACRPTERLRRIRPLQADLNDYHSKWNAEVNKGA
jgi:sugar (pentulose or hexulose) kinase